MGIDKLCHFIVGVILGFINLPLGLFAGIGIEIYDYFTPTYSCEALDILATMVGAYIGFKIRLLIKRYIP